MIRSFKSKSLNFFFKNKKGIGPIVASSLLIIVAVMTVVFFQNWYGMYSSTVFTNTETKSNEASDFVDIEGIIGNNIYLKYGLDDNLTINDIKIGSKSCGINYTLKKGINEIDLGFCPIGVDEYAEITIITNSKLNTETKKLRSTSRVLDLNLMYVSPSNGETVSIGSDVVINVSSAYNLYNCTLYWDDGSTSSTHNMEINNKNCNITMTNLPMNTYTYYVIGSINLSGSIKNDTSSSQNLFTTCISLSSGVDNDLDGYNDSSFALYPACDSVLEGHLDSDDSNSSIHPNIDCMWADDKSACAGNLIIDGCGAGTVLDLSFGLCWQRDTKSSGEITWPNAKTYCNTTLGLGGHSDWYLPSTQELFTITDLSRSGPAVVGGSSKFQNIGGGSYISWSNTATSTTKALSIDLSTGRVNGAATKASDTLYALCVRKNH